MISRANFKPIRTKIARASTRALLCAYAALALAACDKEEPPEPSAVASSPVGAVDCTPDPAALAEDRTCFVDDDCPCGSHCAQGRCDAGCTTGAACGADEWCDRFGNCRLSDDTRLTPPLSPVQGGVVDVSPTRLMLAGGQAQIRVTAIDRPVKAIRLMAGDGLEMSCGGYKTECVAGPLAAGATLTFDVRETKPFADSEARGIAVYADAHHTRVSVTGVGAAAADVPLRGAYRGTARLVSTSFGGESVTLSGADVLSVPVYAQIYDTEETIVLEEPNGALHPAGQWVGSIEAGGAIDLPTFAIRTPAGADDAEVLVDSPATMYQTSGAAERTVRFELDMQYRGVVADVSRAPANHWEIALVREGALPAGSAPTRPADAAASLAAEALRRDTRTAWEDVVNEALNISALSNAQLAKLIGTYGDEAGAHDACYLDEAARDTLWGYAIASADGWGPAAPNVPPNTMVSSGLYTNNDNALVRALSRGMVNSEDWSGLFATMPSTWGDVYIAPPADQYTSTNGQTLTDAIPCAATYEPLALAYNDCNGTFVGPVITPDATDECSEMASAFGCTPMVVSTPASPLGTISSVNVQVTGGQCPISFDFINKPVVGSVTKVCVFPETLKTCSDLVLCVTPEDSAMRDSVASSRLSVSKRNAKTGDATCSDSPRDAGLDIDRSTDLASTLLGACLDDLDRRGEAAPDGAPPSGAGLTDLFVTSGCVDAVRHIAALGISTASLRSALTESDIDDREARLAHRLLQRWTHVLTFVARERSELQRLSSAIGRLNPGDGSLPPSLDAVLEKSIKGFDLLLHPRFAAALDKLPADVLKNPDYRQNFGAEFEGALPSEDQPEGLPLALVEALEAQVELASARVEQGRYQGDSSALEAARGALSNVGLIRPIAAALASRAGQGVGWLDRFHAANNRLMLAIQRLRVEADALRSGKNPLGIEPGDLPLYFSTDLEGASNRFAPVSGFLAGTSPNDARWAPFMIAEAEEALDDARDAWIRRGERVIQKERDAAELEEKVDEVRRRYGDQLSGLCGGPSSLSTNELLEHWEEGHGATFSADNCYIDLSRSECKLLAEGPNAPISRDDAQHQLCIADSLRQRLGSGVRYASEELNRALESFSACQSPANVTIETCTVGSEEFDQCYVCTNGETNVKAPISALSFATLDTAGASAALLDRARAACAVAWPNARQELPRSESELDRRGCYSGALGEAALTVRSTVQSVGIARSEVNDYLAAYDVAMRSCFRLEKGKQDIDAAEDSFQETVKRLTSAKLAFDLSALAARGTGDCLDAANGGAVGQFLSGGATTVGVCVARAAEAVAEGASTGLQFSIDEAQTKHDATIQKLQLNTELDRCFIEAEMNLVGMRTAAMRARQALTDLQAAELAFENLKGDAESAYADGHAALAATRGHFVTPMAEDYWVDEAVDRYTSRMRSAKRVTYLAVQALSYEFQQSSSLADELSKKVLAAELPEDLHQVMEQIWVTSGTHAIQGNRPEEQRVVVSLRKQLLQLADNSSLPPSELRLTDVQRFRLRLMSPRYALYADDGRYLGQKVPFMIAPNASFELADSPEAAVIAPSDCAERLWSVNASVLGTSDLVQGDDATFTGIELWKSNEFFSQWCDPSGRPADFQQAAVRPTRNLLREPGTDMTALGEEYGVSNENTLFSRARMQPSLNVDRGEFSSDRYTDGASSELAGRGLYGNYALFIPAEVLSRRDERGLLTTGLDLNEVDDILLRLDYVSVAR